MKINQKTAQDRLILELRGDFDGWASPAFLECVTQLLVAGHRRFELDLAEVGFLSSQGVSSLLQARSAARRLGGALHLRCLSDVARWTLACLGVEHLLVSGPQAA